MDRRDFIRAAAGAAALAGAESFSWRARAALAPVTVDLFHLADAAGSNSARDKLFIDDLKARIRLELGQDCIYLVSGPVNDSELAKTAALRFGLFYFPPDGKPKFSTAADLSSLAKQLDKNAGAGLPAVLLSHQPVDRKLMGDEEPERQELLDLLRRHPEVLLVVTAGGLNRASLAPGGSPLLLATAPACSFPCGGRYIRLEVGADGTVHVLSRFVQTRLLYPLENTFQRGTNFSKQLARLGGRLDRGMTADGGTLSTIITPPGPNLAPFNSDSATFDLAIVTDIHVTLDKFITQKDGKKLKLIGHSTEKASQAVLADVISQLAEGRHRLEFYDEVFSAKPDSDEHYLVRPLDAVFFLGDLTEYGRREENAVFRDIIRKLPKPLIECSLMTPGNHDYFTDLSTHGMASDRAEFCEYFREFGLPENDTYRVVPLTDWLTVIMVDSVVPTSSALGVVQDRIDWLEDMLEQQKNKTVIIAAHHDLYPLSVVPPALNAYLHKHSHFTAVHSSTRMQLQKLFARFRNVKVCLSGHYHATVADMFKKDARVAGKDDGYTVHLQTPCLAEYPAGYRLLRVSREGNRGRMEYHTAYTREWQIRDHSHQATAYKLSGIESRHPPGYEGSVTELQKHPGFWGDLFRASPFDLIDFNVIGFKDGTSNLGHGNGRLRNIHDAFEFDLP